MNGFTPEEMSRGGDAAAAVAAVVAAAAAAAASAGNGAGAGAGAEVPGAGAVSAAGPPGAAGPGPGQLCCLREEGERCGRAAGNASFSKRIQKSISQKKVKIELDKSVDLYQLQVNTLRRYKRHFKLSTRPGLNKAQLVEGINYKANEWEDLPQKQQRPRSRLLRPHQTLVYVALEAISLFETVSGVSQSKPLMCGLHPSGVTEGGSVGKSSIWF